MSELQSQAIGLRTADGTGVIAEEDTTEGGKGCDNNTSELALGGEISDGNEGDVDEPTFAGALAPTPPPEAAGPPAIGGDVVVECGGGGGGGRGCGTREEVECLIHPSSCSRDDATVLG